MARTMNLTFAGRENNEDSLSGAEATEVEAVDSPDQEITAAAEEATAMGGFQARQLKSLTLRSDQDVKCQFLGDRIPILTLVANDLLGAEVIITHAGDMTGIIFPGDLIRIEGATTPANDNVYLVLVVVAGQIDLDNGEQVVAQVGAGGTFAKVMSAQQDSWGYTIVTAAAGPPPVLTFTGDLTDVFEDGDWIVIQGSTDTPPGKDAVYEIDTIAYVAGTNTTTITLTADKVMLDATDDGEFSRYNPFIRARAGEPFIWTFQSGINNPMQALNHDYALLQSPVTFLLVDNPGATAANFQARIAKNALLP